MNPSFTGFDVFLYDFLLYSLDIRSIPRLDIRGTYYSRMYDNKQDFGFLYEYKYITYKDISIIKELFR